MSNLKLEVHKSFLVPFFEEMNKSFKDKWCVLHSYETLPEYSSSDVDMALNSDETHKLENLILNVSKKTGWDLYQKLWYDIDKCFYYVLFLKKTKIFLAIDFLIDKKGIGKYGFSTKVLTKNCNTFKNFIPIPNNTVSFCYKFVKRIFKQIPLEKDKEYLTEHYNSANREQINIIFKKQFGSEVTKKLLEKFSNKDFIFNDYEIKKLYSKKIELQNKKNRLIKYICIVNRKLNRVIKPCGLIISIPLINKEELEEFRLQIINKTDLLFRYVIINKNNSFFTNFKSLCGSTLVITSNSKNNIEISNHWLLPKVYKDNLNKEFTNEELVEKSFQLLLGVLKDRNRVVGSNNV